MTAGSALMTEHRFLHGTRQIVEFNWPKYVAAGVAILLGTCLLGVLEPGAIRWIAGLAVGLGMWWTVTSLVVSWWTYDATALTTWIWLPQLVGHPQSWANVHAGFDETTPSLRSVFPASRGCAVDIYDQAVVTEASIRRARRRSAHVSAICGSWKRLPLASSSQEAVFFLFSAHELRAHDQRATLLREAARLLKKPGGRVVLVEHLRDAANFVAFGPGFQHFHSRRAWRSAAARAGLRVSLEKKLNPFVAVFIMECAS